MLRPQDWRVRGYQDYQEQEAVPLPGSCGSQDPGQPEQMGKWERKRYQPSPLLLDPLGVVTQPYVSTFFFFFFFAEQ